MRILKYIFLLIVLFAVAASVFVATQKGEYDVTTRMFIRTPRQVVFQYIDDYRNWQGWFHRQYEPEFAFPAYTGGRGGSFSFSSDLNSGKYLTVVSNAADSIVQRTEIDGFQGEAIWKLKDSAGGSRISLRSIGKMGFWTKVRATLAGGPQEVMSQRQREAMVELGQAINRDINRYKIRIDGTVDRPGTHYIGYSITSTLDNAPKNIRLLMSKLMQFFGRNKIPMAGKPFVLYEYWDDRRNLTRFTVCGPVNQEVHIMPGSDMTAGMFSGYKALRTTLTGDHSHLRRAWDETFRKMQATKLIPADGQPYLEVYTSGKLQQKSPSGWVTEIYVPIKQSAPVKPAIARPRPVQRDPERAEPVGEISIP